MTYNKNDIIYAHLLFYKHFHGATFEYESYKQHRINRIFLKIIYMFKSYYLPINEITSKPMTENAREIYKNLIVKFNILNKCYMNVDEYVDLIIQTDKEGFILF